MYKIGNIAKLQYYSEIKNSLTNYIVAYSIDLLKQTSYIDYFFKVQANNSLNPDEFGDLLTTILLNDKNLDIVADIIKCNLYIDADDNAVNPMYLVSGLTSNDCLPVGCQTFICL